MHTETDRFDTETTKTISPNNNQLSSTPDTSTDVKISLTSSQLQLEPEFGSGDHGDIPNIKFRDVVLAKKFGSWPYNSDR